jgi:hypothetical protein
MSSKVHTEQKLRDITIPEITFMDAPFPLILAFVSDESKRLDPEHQGVQLVLSERLGLSRRTWALALRDIPLVEFVRLFASEFSCEYRIEGARVIFYPRSTRKD